MCINYRIYADGNIYHEDDFEDLDNAKSYHDDYNEVSVLEEIVNYIIDVEQGK